MDFRMVRTLILMVVIAGIMEKSYTNGQEPAPDPMGGTPAAAGAEKDLGTFTVPEKGVGGKATLKTKCKIEIEKFLFDGSDTKSHFIAMKGTAPTAANFKIESFDGKIIPKAATDGCKPLEKSEGEGKTFTLILPKGEILKDGGWIGVYSTESKMVYGAIPVMAADITAAGACVATRPDACGEMKNGSDTPAAEGEAEADAGKFGVMIPVLIISGFLSQLL